MWPFVSNTARFFRALENSNLELLQRALSRGASANARKHGKSALAYALEHRSNTELVKTLLDAKADPNVPLQEGQTPRALHYVCRNFPERDLLDALLIAGANPNVAITSSDQELNGMTPLLLAATSSLPNIAERLRVLLEGGADAQARDAHGRTALMHLASAQREPRTQELRGRLNEINGERASPGVHSLGKRPVSDETEALDALRLLLAARTDISATDSLGLSALDHALLSKNDEFAIALRLAGAPLCHDIGQVALPLDYARTALKRAI